MVTALCGCNAKGAGGVLGGVSPPSHTVGQLGPGWEAADPARDQGWFTRDFATDYSVNCFNATGRPATRPFDHSTILRGTSPGC
jgi:hypothetical protein